MKTRTKNILIWVIIIFVSFVFVLIGVLKLLSADTMIEKLKSWGFPLWTRFPIGIIELGLGILLLLPKSRKTAIYLILVWGFFAMITYIQAGQIIQSGLPLLLALVTGSILPISGIKTLE